MQPTAPPPRAASDGTGAATGTGTGALLAALASARKALRFYPPTNPQVRVTLRRFREALEEHAARRGSLRLQVERDRFAEADEGVALHEADLSRLAFKLHCLDVREVELVAGLGEDELVALLAVLNQPFEALRALGPLHATLASRGVEHVRVHYAEAVVPGREGEARAAAPPPVDPFLRRPRHLLNLLADPGQFARELVRLCVEIVPEPGQRRLDAQLAFVDRFLHAAASAIEGEPAEARPELYARLSTALEALARRTDVSGARQGGLPRVDLAQIDPRVLEVLPQRDLVKEVSSKVKLHQGATTVMASALRQLQITASAEHANPVLRVLEERQDSARSVTSNIQVLDEIRIGQEVDGEYPGIAYAERDRNKNFAVAEAQLRADIRPDERRLAQRLVDDLEDWRPDVSSIETLLDMLHNERNPRFLALIAARMAEKLNEFLDRGELEPALVILRGFNVERRKRRGDAEAAPVLEEALRRLEEPPTVGRLLAAAERLPVESPAFEDVKSFLFLLDKRVVHTLVELVSVEGSRFGRRRALELAQFLCRNRLDLLAEGLRSPRPETVKTIVWLLGRFGAQAVPWLRRAGHHPDPRVRREAARSLAAVEGEDSSRALAALLADRDDGVAVAALRALVARGAREAAPAVEALVSEPGLLDRSEELVAQAVRAATRLGGEATAGALRRLDERARSRWALKGLRDLIRQAQRELDERPR